MSAKKTDEKHSLDDALGFVHELALRLALAGLHADAVHLAEAHEQIQRWVIDHDRKEDASEMEA